MLQENPNSSVLTVSPPDSGFSPRREFVRESHVISSFALLSIAGSSSVRLTSFRREIIHALRMYLLERLLLRGYKEDKALCVFEFTLQNKPWANTKNVESEKLFIDILTIIYIDGYNFVSTIDYGRESDERTCLAFSRPVPSGDPSSLTAFIHRRPIRVPFAISFPSSTVLRVINPPRTSTPAILTGVRDAWPRGVVDERKFAGECFEFKLRGYKWFQEDTFSADSLKYILALLGSLDESSSTLVTSISLSGSRSRVKDLWIFIGPPQEFSEILSSSSPDLVRTLSPSGGSSSLNTSSDALHRRSGSAPVHILGSSPLAAHARCTTEPAALPLTRSRSVSPQNSRAVLRKKSSRGSQEPTPPSSSHGSPHLRRSSMDESRLSGSGNNYHIADDMTGIGRIRTLATRSANDLTNGHRDRDSGPVYNGSPPPLTGPTFVGLDRDSIGNEGSQPGRVKTGDLFYETGPMVQLRQDIKQRTTDSSSSRESGPLLEQSPLRDLSSPLGDAPHSVYEPAVLSERSSTSRIMNSNVFRDSAFSSATSHSYEIPIKWTGPDEDKWRERVTAIPGLSATPSPEGDGGRQSTNGTMDKTRRTMQRQSTAFNVPGAWQPSPIDEKAEEHGGLAHSRPSRGSDIRKRSDPEMKEVDAARVFSPVLSDTPGASRRSQVALYGMTPNRVQMPPSSSRPAHHRQHSDVSPPSPSSLSSPVSGTGGWVLVSFADSSSRPNSGSIGEGTSQTDFKGSSRQRPTSDRNPSNPMAEQKSSLHPVAKVIAAADARSPASHEETQSSSALRRIFSIKSRSRRNGVDKRTGEVKVIEKETVQSVRKTSFRDRWRRRG